MSGLAIINRNGEKINYTGTQFSGLENIGNHHLCVRTGAGLNDVIKYGLTSTPLNDKYKALKMKISNIANGKYAYIAQRYSISKQTSISNTYITTRISNYVSSNTLVTKSSTKSSMISTILTSSVSNSNSKTYYGTTPVTALITSSTSFTPYGNFRTSSIGQSKEFDNGDPEELGYINGNFIVITAGRYPYELENFHTSLTYWSSKPTVYVRQVFDENGRWSGTITNISSFVKDNNGVNTSYLTYSYKIRGSLVLQPGIGGSDYPKWLAIYTITKVLSTYTYTSNISTLLRTNSSSKLSTKNTTRVSSYSTSSSMNTTTSLMTHNINI